MSLPIPVRDTSSTGCDGSPSRLERRVAENSAASSVKYNDPPPVADHPTLGATAKAGEAAHNSKVATKSVPTHERREIGLRDVLAEEGVNQCVGEFWADL